MCERWSIELCCRGRGFPCPGPWACPLLISIYPIPNMVSVSGLGLPKTTLYISQSQMSALSYG